MVHLILPAASGAVHQLQEPASALRPSDGTLEISTLSTAWPGNRPGPRGSL